MEFKKPINDATVATVLEPVTTVLEPVTATATAVKLEAIKKPRKSLKGIKITDEKRLLALAEGRKKRDANAVKRKEENQKTIDEIVIKKANRIIKRKLNLKHSIVGDEDVDDEDDELIIPIQPKKPKKKKIVYLPDVSDSEEEIVYKKPPKAQKPVAPVAPVDIKIFW